MAYAKAPHPALLAWSHTPHRRLYSGLDGYALVDRRLAINVSARSVGPDRATENEVSRYRITARNYPNVTDVIVRHVGAAGSETVLAEQVVTGACKVTGCSGQLCVPANKTIGTSCKWLPRYGCMTGCNLRNGTCGFNQEIKETCIDCIERCRDQGRVEDCFQQCYPD